MPAMAGLSFIIAWPFGSFLCPPPLYKILFLSSSGSVKQRSLCSSREPAFLTCPAGLARATAFSWCGSIPVDHNQDLCHRYPGRARGLLVTLTA
ncbi:hypothetical protein F4818DRAFT_406697 [Hypoxylon cercidicola]|nr:hypothetical protein F4818DRAFT_406697 [Hypoxylon cercidicola]